MSHVPAPPFAHYSGSRQPKLLLIGEAWGASEDELKMPFVGESGRLLWRMLGEVWADGEPTLYRQAWYEWPSRRDAWLEAIGIGMTNVLAFRPPNNKIEVLSWEKKQLPSNYPKGIPPIITSPRQLFLKEEFLSELNRLSDELDQTRPNVVVAIGNTACWALLATTGIMGIRGSTSLAKGIGPLADYSGKVIGTIHPAAIMKNWPWRPIAVADLIKARRESASPQLIRPERQVIINPSIEDIELWIQENLIASPPALLSCDIETKAGQITFIGFSKSKSQAIVIPFWNSTSMNGHYWSTPSDEERAWSLVSMILRMRIPKLFQNGMYDLQYLARQPPFGMGLRVNNCLHDSMLLHHSILPEMQKGLGFLASIYSNEQSWKLMRRKRADTEKADE